MALSILRPIEDQGQDPRADPTPELHRQGDLARRPALRVISGRGTKWPAVVGSIVVFLVLVAMLGAAVFHTQLAQRQLTVDQLERQVADERIRFDELRRDRAVLRSPQRIAKEAAALGMVRSDEMSFVEVDPLAFARQLAVAGASDDDGADVISNSGPLEQFRDVKSVSLGQP